MHRGPFHSWLTKYIVENAQWEPHLERLEHSLVDIKHVIQPWAAGFGTSVIASSNNLLRL